MKNSIDENHCRCRVCRCCKCNWSKSPQWATNVTLTTKEEKQGILTGRRMSRCWWGRRDCIIGSRYTGRESTYIGPLRERRGPPMGPTTASTSRRSEYASSPHRATTLKISKAPIFIHRWAWRFSVSRCAIRCVNTVNRKYLRRVRRSVASRKGTGIVSLSIVSSTSILSNLWTHFTREL